MISIPLNSGAFYTSEANNT